MKFIKCNQNQSLNCLRDFIWNPPPVKYILSANKSDVSSVIQLNIYKIAANCHNRDTNRRGSDFGDLVTRKKLINLWYLDLRLITTRKSFFFCVRKVPWLVQYLDLDKLCSTDTCRRTTGWEALAPECVLLTAFRVDCEHPVSGAKSAPQKQICALTFTPIRSRFCCPDWLGFVT